MVVASSSMSSSLWSRRYRASFCFSYTHRHTHRHILFKGTVNYQESFCGEPRTMTASCWYWDQQGGKKRGEPYGHEGGNKKNGRRRGWKGRLTKLSLNSSALVIASSIASSATRRATVSVSAMLCPSITHTHRSHIKSCIQTDIHADLPLVI